MRGPDEQTSDMFSYLSPEQRVRADHPLRAIRAMTDRVFAELSPRFTTMYSTMGRPSIPPEQLLRALLLQSLYTVRSERLLMEEIDYSMLFRWFVGMNLDEPVWDVTVFTKNRDRLLEGDVAREGGAAGAEAIEGGRRWRADAPNIEAVDTTGAGDAFVAGFLAAQLTGADIRVALGRAAGAGMTAATIIGGQPRRSNVHPDR